jgi:hypothetical protein
MPRATDEATVSTETKLLELMTENIELRAQLAEAQEHCIEMAVDAGELQAEIEVLRLELVEARSAHRPRPTARTQGGDPADGLAGPASTAATRQAEP